MTRDAAIALIWRKAGSRRHTLQDGRRAVFVQRGVGHFHVPLTDLTDQEIANHLPCAPLSASMLERIALMGPTEIIEDEPCHRCAA